MSKSINQVILFGNVGKDPEIRVLEGGVKVATFSLATSTGGYKKNDGTDVPEKTQWHNIVAWRGLADISERFVKKGDKILIQGSVSYRNYEDKDGVKRYTTDILAYDITLCGKPESKSSFSSDNAPTRDDFPPMPQSDDLPF